MDAVLKKYQDRLHDITRRNRSLFLCRLTMRKVFDVTSLPEDVADKVRTDLLEKGKSVYVMTTNLKKRTDEPVLKALNYLIRDLELQFQETGLYECYIGYPFVEGSFSDGTYFRAPLLLYPVKVELNRATKKIHFHQGEAKPFLNRTLLLAMNKFDKKFHGISQAELDRLGELSQEELYPKALRLFESLNFTVEAPKQLSSNKLKPVKELKADYKKDTKGTITILPHMVLGQFSQFNTSINNDYEQIMAKKSTNELFDIFVGNKASPAVKDIIDDPSEEENYFVSTPDISQELVMAQARESKGLVIHGPPGTGKSQVITNYIADRLARGKKILLVCEKRAAIDVVYNRLSGFGLDAYSLVVHDVANDRNEVFAKIAGQLEKYDVRLGGTITEFEKLAKKFDMSLASLAQIIEQMHEPKRFGVSLYTLYRSVDPNAKVVLPISEGFAKKFDKESLDELIANLSVFANDIYRITENNYPLHHRKYFTKETDIAKLRAGLKELKSASISLIRQFYMDEFKQDIKLINAKKPVSREWLLGFGENLVAYDKQKDSKVRFANPWWMFVSYSLRRVIRENKLSDLIARWSKVTQYLQQVQNALEQLSPYFKPAFSAVIWRKIATFEPLESYVNSIIKSLDDADLLIKYDVMSSKLSSNEKKLIDICLKNLPAQKGDMRPVWEAAIRNSFALTWISVLEKSFPKVSEFTYAQHDSRMGKLRTTLSQKIDLVPKTIHLKQKVRYQRLREAEGNPIGSIIHEVTKKRNRLGVRGLVEKNQDALLKLYPVWMCSPENVSNLFALEPDMFDILIFDEASQTRIERAVPALVRAKQLIVAGDEHQLPPTSFFSGGDDDEDYDSFSYEEQQLLENESLLMRCKAVFPSRKLLYHYRSKHKELIDFSNHAFYESDLRMIPETQSSFVSPMTYLNVGGVWHNNCNDVEAQHVVRLVKKLLSSKINSGKTIGIITFNVKQRDLIEDYLDMEAKRDSAFAAKLDEAKSRTEHDEFVGLFVKNIENVQGDERDIIIFSIGYGYDQSKKFRYNFGPLNGVYGPNRLNVAISRAREEVYVIASIDAEDFNYKGKHRGPVLLGQYLQYASLLSNKQPGRALTVLEDICPSPKQESAETEEFVAELERALIDLGLTVKKTVGTFGYTIDLAVVEKGTCILGIECDGTAYEASPSAKEREVYRPAVLKAFGWNVIRVFARDWWRNPKAQIRRIELEVKNAKSKC